MPAAIPNFASRPSSPPPLRACPGGPGTKKSRRHRRRPDALTCGCEEPGVLHQLVVALLLFLNPRLVVVADQRGLVERAFSMNSFHSGVARTCFSRST